MRPSRRPLRLLVALAALAAMLLAAAPASAAPGDWWQFGYTAANTRFNPNETTIGSANVGRLVVAARQQPTLGGRNAAHASAVAVANGRAYVQVGDYESGSDALLAYDPASFGSPARWQQPSGCGSTSPTVHLGIVFVGSIACRPSGDDGGVRALDGATGQLLWYSHSLGIGNGTEDAGNVAATDGAVYFSGYANAVYGGDNALLSLDARTGAPRWNVAVAGASSPAVANGLVYAGLARGIGAWRLSDGVRRWTSGTAGYGAPVISGGRVYASATTLVGGEPVTYVDQFALS
jgi:outer membrane protein assembly factor BamB